MVNEPREISEDAVVWAVIGMPKPCLCGHTHYPRIPTPNTRGLAIWWGFCEDAQCICRRLHTQYHPLIRDHDYLEDRYR